jgi:hypothetical protein
MDQRHHLVRTRVQSAVAVAVAIMVLKEKMVDPVVAVQELEHQQRLILRLSPVELAAHRQIRDGLQEDLQVELELITVVLEVEGLVQSAHLQPRVFPALGEMV